MRRFLFKSVRRLSKRPRKSDGHRKMNEASDKEKDTIEENNVVTGPQVPEGVGEKAVDKGEGETRTILRILCLKIGQRWPEDEMHKWGSYFVPVPKG